MYLRGSAEITRRLTPQVKWVAARAVTGADCVSGWAELKTGIINANDKASRSAVSFFISINLLFSFLSHGDINSLCLLILSHKFKRLAAASDYLAPHWALKATLISLLP